MANSNYPLRLPESIIEEAKAAARQDGVSLNQFIGTALAEKVSALRTQTVLNARAAAADRAKFDAVMKKARDEPPREGDEIG